MLLENKAISSLRILGFNLRLSYQRLKKLVLDASLLNTQHYKAWIKGKVEQSKERNSALLSTSVL